MTLQMQRAIKAYLIIGNVVAAVLLSSTSERLNETVQVINWHAGPVLKQTQDDNANQVHVGDGEHQQVENEKARASLERILEKAQAEAMRVMTEVRIIAAGLLVNAILFGWLCGRRAWFDTANTMPK